MSHVHYHCRSSVNSFGGQESDYLKIHNWFDDTKSQWCDMRHRALKHHSLGIFWCEEKFGLTITNSDEKEVPVRLIAEQHVREDCGGMIPTVADWLETIRPAAWMNRGYATQEARKVITPLRKV